jgi:(2Fe-2S) ferredoxin
VKPLQKALDFHVFVCQNERPPGHPRGCCKEKGSEALLQALKSEAAKRGLKGNVRVQKSGCLDVCEDGAALVAYAPHVPNGLWFGDAKPEDAPALIDKLLSGT